MTGHSRDELRGRQAASVLSETGDGTGVIHAKNGDAIAVRLRCADTPHGKVAAFAPVPRIDQIEQLKNELVGTVSHELKTPLAAIKAYTATLRDNPALYEDRRTEYLAIVEEQADRLSRLIEDLLLVTRVEGPQLLRRRIAVGLNEVIERAMAGVRLDPALHHIERPARNVMLSGDPDRLCDVFRNLLENAAKYSPDGGPIEIRAKETADRVVVEIADRGAGISKDDLPYIFDRFYRADSDLTRKTGGSGLGLSIVQALVRAHGGTVEARGRAGGGTVFAVTLPVRA